MKLSYIAFAPLQGYTDCVYRRAHWQCAGGVDEYYTPFVRLEGGTPRAKDLRDIDPERNAGVPTVPQVIARDAEEFARLCDAVQALGWRRIDLNMGCPFPMQVKAGRGCGLMQHPDRVEQIAQEMLRRPEVAFSVKMRLGQEHTQEGLALLSIINTIPLVHVTLHPRLGRQQYKGLVDMDAFLQFFHGCRHPMIYNGDITESDGYGRHPYVVNGVLVVEGLLDEADTAKLKGVMIGRGLLARPWMLTDKQPTAVLTAMHAELYRHATQNLCGDSQILARLHAFWEYMDSHLDKKSYKGIMKSTTLSRYNEAVRAALTASTEQRLVSSTTK